MYIWSSLSNSPSWYLRHSRASRQTPTVWYSVIRIKTLEVESFCIESSSMLHCFKVKSCLAGLARLLACLENHNVILKVFCCHLVADRGDTSPSQRSHDRCQTLITVIMGQLLIQSSIRLLVNVSHIKHGPCALLHKITTPTKWWA